MPITQRQLLQILPNAGSHAGVFVPLLNTAMSRFQILGPSRIAAFIAQVGHESGHLKHTVESLDYSVEALLTRFGRHRISEADARAFGRTPRREAYQQTIAKCIYGGDWGAKNLGNTEPDDGWMYRGRAALQITGRANYEACGEALGIDLISNPEWLEQPRYSTLASGWFWFVHCLNRLADVGAFDDIGSIINTGMPGKTPHGAQQRRALYEVALKVLA